MASFGRLHLITDTRPGRDPLGVLRAALAVPGAAADLVVQLRVEDHLTDREAYELAGRVRQLCAPAGVPWLVNDRLDVALAAGAGGGHVGAHDLPVGVARRVLGPAALLGATAREPAAARTAVAHGASYLGVGPAYPSGTKPALPEPIGPAGVGAVAADLPGTPVIAIGGITVDRVPELLAAGAYGVAVVGAVFAAADPGRAVAELLDALRRGPRPPGAEPERPGPPGVGPHRAAGTAAAVGGGGGAGVPR